jgi:hypothetical protein
MERGSIEIGLLANRFYPKEKNLTPDLHLSNFSQVIPAIGYRNNSLLIYLGYFSFEANDAPTSELNLVATYSLDFRLLGDRKSYGLFLPILISADYMRVERTGEPGSNRFDVSSGGVGAGLKGILKAGSLRFTILLSSLITYSAVSFSMTYGFSRVDYAEATVGLTHLIRDIGLILGYRYRDQSWSVQDSRYDYFSSWHGPYVGVIF